MPTLTPSERSALLVLSAAALLALAVSAWQAPAPEIELPRLELNRATPEELEALPGLGPVLARRIVIDRQTHGPFRTVEDLDRVRGIGPGLLARLRPYLTVTPEGGKGVKEPDQQR